MPTITDLYGLAINKGTRNDGCDITFYIHGNGIASATHNADYERSCTLIPKEFATDIKIGTVFDDWYHIKNTDPYTHMFAGPTLFRNGILSRIPEGSSIEEFMDPIIKSGYKDSLEVEYFGMAFVNVYEDKLKNDPELEVKIKKNIEEYYKNESIYEILKDHFDYSKLSDETAEEQHKSTHKFHPYECCLRNIGITYKIYVPREYIDHPRELINILQFDEMFEVLDSKTGQHDGIFGIPLKLKLRLEKAIKANCPPFSKEVEIDRLYSEGVPMEVNAVPKAYRMFMDFLKYNDKLEVVKKLKAYRKNSTWEHPEMFLQIKQDNGNLTPIENEIREHIKNCSDLTDENWLALILRCFMFLNAGSVLHKEGVNESFLSERTSSLAISEDAGFDKDFTISMNRSGNSHQTMSPNYIIKKFQEDINDLETWAAGFKEVCEFLKGCYSEEEMDTPVSMEEFVIRVLGRTVPVDPLSIITIAEKTEGHRLCPYLEPAAKIARNLLS